MSSVDPPCCSSLPSVGRSIVVVVIIVEHPPRIVYIELYAICAPTWTRSAIGRGDKTFAAYRYTECRTRWKSWTCRKRCRMVIAVLHTSIRGHVSRGILGKVLSYNI